MTIKAIVFDIGGVVVELGPVTDILGSAALDPAEFWPKWLKSDAVRAFEMGHSDEATFAAAMAGEFGVTGNEFVANFAAWPKGLFDGAVELVESLRGTYTICCLSNTNALHWEHQVDAPIIQGLFDRVYLSYRIGLAKPDKPIFEAMIADLGVAPDEILFLDDNQPNIDGATAVGIVAHRVFGPAEAKAVCEDILGHRL